MANAVGSSRADAFMEALDECKEFGRRLRKNRLFVAKALRNGRTKAARVAGAPSSPWPPSYELRSRERGVQWSEELASRCCVFCDNPNTPGSAKPFSTPEEMVAHLRVFHTQFEYSFEVNPDFCYIILKLSKKPVVPLHAHPERRTGAELLYANENKYRGYVPIPPSSPGRRRRLSSPANYGQDEYNPFTLIPSKVLVDQVEVPDDYDSDLDESEGSDISRINRATPAVPKNPTARTSVRPPTGRTGETGNGGHSRGNATPNRQRASVSRRDVMSRTPSPPHSTIDVDELPDRLSDMQPVMIKMRQEKSKGRKERKRQQHYNKKQKTASSRTMTSGKKEPLAAVNAAVLENPPAQGSINSPSAVPADVARQVTTVKKEDVLLPKRRPNGLSKRIAVRTPMRHKSPSPNHETALRKSANPVPGRRSKRSRTPPKKLGRESSRDTDDESDTKPRPRKRARTNNTVYIAPELGPLIIKPGKKPLNSRGLPQITKEFVKNKLFHSILNHEIIVEDFNNGFDSDGAEDHDVEWRLAFKNNLLHDFVDMFAVEKIFMNLWNQFSIKEYKIISDKCVYPALHAFLNKYGPEIRRIHFEALFVRHLSVLYRCGLVDAEGVHELLKKLKRIRPSHRAHPDFIYGLNMLRNENFVPRTYTTARWCKSMDDPADDLEEDHFNSRSLFPSNPYSSKVIGVPERSPFTGTVTHSGPSSHPNTGIRHCSPLARANGSTSVFVAGGSSSRPGPVAQSIAPAVGGPTIRPHGAGGSSSPGTGTGQPSRPMGVGSRVASSRPGAFVASPSARPVGGQVIGHSPRRVAAGPARIPGTPSPPRAVSPILAVGGPSTMTGVLGARRSMHPAAGPPTPGGARRVANVNGGPNSGNGTAHATHQGGGLYSHGNRSGANGPRVNVVESKEDSDGVVIISD